jgi:cysteine desulfurase
MTTDGRVYLDHAATTPLDPRVLDAMLPYLRDHWGNPSSLYAEAQEARRGLEWARRTVAETLGARPGDIVFTSGGTESDNLALRGAAYGARQRARAQGRDAGHIITTRIEHHAVLHATERLEQEGFRVTYLGVDREGFIDLAELEEAVGQDTALVSIMYVNNEIGTIEPVQEAARIVKEKNRGTVFHTDAVQAIGALDVNVERLGADLLSMAAHKFYGPRGIGALYVRPRTPMQWQALGGSQEKNRRAGTENVAGAVGLARALQLAYEEFESRNAHCRALRDKLLFGIPERVPHVHITGPYPNLPLSPGGQVSNPAGEADGGHLPSPAHGRGAGGEGARVSNNASFCFEYLEGEAVLMALDLAGVAASSGSACTSGSLEPSHVLTACRIPEDLARGSMRLTAGKDNTHEQIDYVLHVLPGIVSRLRELSPAWRNG